LFDKVSFSTIEQRRSGRLYTELLYNLLVHTVAAGPSFASAGPLTPAYLWGPWHQILVIYNCTTTQTVG